MVCFEVCLPHMSACELVQGDEHKIAPHVYPCDPMVAIGWGGGSFSGGSETFTVLRESRQEATFTILRPFPVGHFYRLTQTRQFFIGVLRVRERGRGGGKIAEIAERAARTSKRRVLLNAAEKIVSQGQPRVALTTPSRASTWLMRSDCFPVVLSMTL